MHIVQETFHTINFRQWEAAQLCNEMAALLADGGVDIEDYPALDTLFGAIKHTSGDDDALISQENDPGEAGASVNTEEE